MVDVATADDIHDELTSAEVEAIRREVESVPKPEWFEIYDAVRLEGQTQRSVAARFGVSQPRVCRILQEVEAWLEQFNDRMAGASSYERRQLADRLLRERLHHLYGKAIQSWKNSGGDAKGNGAEAQDCGRPIYLRLAAWLAERLAKAEETGGCQSKDLPLKRLSNENEAAGELSHVGMPEPVDAAALRVDGGLVSGEKQARKTVNQAVIKQEHADDDEPLGLLSADETGRELPITDFQMTGRRSRINRQCRPADNLDTCK